MHTNLFWIEFVDAFHVSSFSMGQFHVLSQILYRKIKITKAHYLTTSRDSIHKKQQINEEMSGGRRFSTTTILGALETATTQQTIQITRYADAVLAAGGAAGSLAFLQFLQDSYFVGTPITAGFLSGSAIKFFFNRNPPSLEAFWKSTAFSVVIGCTLNWFLWKTNGSDGDFTTIFSNEHNGYLILFLVLLFWKLDSGSIWSAGMNLGNFLAFQSGFWGRHASGFLAGFPTWYIVGPYLLGHTYLYLCAMLFSYLRKRVRIFILRKDLLSSPRKGKSFIGPQGDREKLREFFQRIDTSGDGRLDAMELKLALRATTGDDVSLQKCNDMIGSVDTDGDGTLDFDEFCELVNNILFRKKWWKHEAGKNK